MVTCYYCFVKR